MSTDIPIAVRELSQYSNSPIKAWMEYLEVDQTELAERLNISQAAVSQICSKSSNRNSTLERIAIALSISVEQLKFNPSEIPLMVIRQYEWS